MGYERGDLGYPELPSLQLAADRKTTWRHFTVADADRVLLRSPYIATPGDKDVAVNNLLSLNTESCAVLATRTGHWLIVRPVYVQMLAATGKEGKGEPLEAAGWLNEGVRPLVVLRAPPELVVPAKEIGYFR